MTELIIIADDLTGAIETGVYLSTQGILTKVIPDPKFNIAHLIKITDATVLVVNTESRHIPASAAVERVRRVINEANSAGVKQFFKKTDSTMRGNIGAELEAFMRETNSKTLAFIPAHPRLKRFTRIGYHFIDEELLHHTIFGKDPLEPIDISYIPDLIHKQSNVNVSMINLEITDQIPEEDGIIVFDCASLMELKHIGEFLAANKLHQAIAGSAAMVEFLPHLLGLQTRKLKNPELHGPTLIINGSLNKISSEQVIHAANEGVAMRSIPTAVLTDNAIQNNPHYTDLISEINEFIKKGHDVILNSTDLKLTRKKYASANPDLDSSNFELVSKNIGWIVKSIFKEIELKSLAVFGGDTLLGIMQALKCEYIDPKIELVPGVALSLAQMKNRNIQLISKPGGYGNKEVIMQLLESINKSKL